MNLGKGVWTRLGEVDDGHDRNDTRRREPSLAASATAPQSPGLAPEPSATLVAALASAMGTAVSPGLSSRSKARAAVLTGSLPEMPRLESFASLERCDSPVPDASTDDELYRRP